MVGLGGPGHETVDSVIGPRRLGRIDESERITIEDSADGDIHLDGLAVAQYDGRTMIDEADIVITAGHLAAPCGLDRRLIHPGPI